jgi:hypothetical protein
MNTGNQNDQAAQPSASNQNNQLVQLSADKNKKRKKREADKKFRDGKKVEVNEQYDPSIFFFLFLNSMDSQFVLFSFYIHLRAAKDRGHAETERKAESR